MFNFVNLSTFLLLNFKLQTISPTLLHLPRLVALNILGNLQGIKAIDGNSKVMIQYVHNSQFANGELI